MTSEELYEKLNQIQLMKCESQIVELKVQKKDAQQDFMILCPVFRIKMKAA